MIGDSIAIARSTDHHDLTTLRNGVAARVQRTREKCRGILSIENVE